MARGLKWAPNDGGYGTDERIGSRFRSTPIFDFLRTNPYDPSPGCPLLTDMRRQSMIRASSIIAIKGKDFIVRHFDHEPTFTKEMLIARDRYMCAYCAQRFRFGELDMEHIVPISKGGATSTARSSRTRWSSCSWVSSTTPVPHLFSHPTVWTESDPSTSCPLVVLPVRRAEVSPQRMPVC
jgi:uncharacterized Zn-finger protein